MWLPAVLGEITRRAAISLFDSSTGDQPQHLDLARGQPGRPFAAAHDAVAGGGEHRFDRIGVEASCCAHRCGARLPRLSSVRGFAVRPRFAHRLVGVGRAEHAGVE